MRELLPSNLLHKPEPDFKIRLRRLLITLTVLLVLGFLLVLVYRVWGVGIPCAIYQVTGLYCPGCGTMRALNALLQLDFAMALRYNLLTVVLSPVLMILLVLEAWYYLRGNQKQRPRWEKPLVIVLIVLFLLFAMLRNLPGFAFLQPPAVSPHFTGYLG